MDVEYAVCSDTPVRYSLMTGRPDRHWLPAADRDLEDAVVNAVVSGQRALTPAERAHLVSQYDGGIAYLDSQIGALLARLRGLGLYDNTLIVITSDHGEAFGEHGLLDHGCGRNPLSRSPGLRNQSGR